MQSLKLIRPMFIHLEWCAFYMIKQQVVELHIYLPVFVEKYKYVYIFSNVYIYRKKYIPNCHGSYIWEDVELKERKEKLFSFFFMRHCIIWSKCIVLVVQMSIK